MNLILVKLNKILTNPKFQFLAIFLLLVTALLFRTLNFSTFDLINLFIPNDYLAYHHEIGTLTSSWIFAQEVMIIFIALAKFITYISGLVNYRFQILQIVEVVSISAAIVYLMSVMLRNITVISSKKFYFLAILPFIASTPYITINFYSDYSFAPFFLTIVFSTFLLLSFEKTRIIYLLILGILLGIIIFTRVSAIVMTAAPLLLFLREKIDKKNQNQKDVLLIYFTFLVTFLICHFIKEKTLTTIHHQGLITVLLYNYLLDLAMALPVIIILLLPVALLFYFDLPQKSEKKFNLKTFLLAISTITSLITLSLIHHYGINEFLMLSLRPTSTIPYTGFSAFKNIYTPTFLAISYLIMIYELIYLYKNDLNKAKYLLSSLILASLIAISSVGGTDIGFSAFAIFSIFIYFLAIITACHLHYCFPDSFKKSFLTYYCAAIFFLLFIFFITSTIQDRKERKDQNYLMPQEIKNYFVAEKTFVLPGIFLFTENLEPSSHSFTYSAAAPDIIIREVINKNPQIYCANNEVFIFNVLDIQDFSHLIQEIKNNGGICGDKNPEMITIPNWLVIRRH